MAALARGLVLAVLLSTGLGDPSASADTGAGSHFTMTVETSPSGNVAPGGTLQYTLLVNNGDSATTSTWDAADTIPAGTALVLHSQTCGTGGGSCSESSNGPTLQWEIPVGSPKATFVMSFSVSIPTDDPPTEILDWFTFSGPGCQPNTTCTLEAPAVAVSGAPVSPVQPITSQPSPVTTVDSGDPPTTVTTVPTGDVQNLIVQVPDCDKHGKKVQCRDPHLDNGSGAQKGVGNTPSPEAGLRGLAATGDNEVRSVKAALVCLLSGSLLVLLSMFMSRKRRP